MARNLRTRGAVAIAQFAADVFSRLRQKRQNWLVTFLAFVLWVVALAPAHLVAKQGVHRGVGIQRDRRQFDVGRVPHSLPHSPLHPQ
jgi:hypothetical protein